MKGRAGRTRGRGSAWRGKWGMSPRQGAELCFARLRFIPRHRMSDRPRRGSIGVSDWPQMGRAGAGHRHLAQRRHQNLSPASRRWQPAVVAQAPLIELALAFCATPTTVLCAVYCTAARQHSDGSAQRFFYPPAVASVALVACAGGRRSDSAVSTPAVCCVWPILVWILGASLAAEEALNEGF